MTAITAATRTIALLGEPVAHSLSPHIQNAAIRAAGLDAVYVALGCDADAFDGLLRGLARAGGAGNVTVPHKERAARIVARATPAVRRTGACNTFWCDDDGVHGDNTDVTGFAAAVREVVGPPAGARVLLLGAGGVARAAVCALLDERVDSIVIVNRTPERARSLRASFDPAGRRVTVVDRIARLDDARFDLAVNATPLGLRSDDPLPLPPDRLRQTDAVLDLVYGSAETRWVREARAGEIRAADGLEMLIHQGAAAFRRWFGRPAPLDAMRQAAARARG